MIVGTKLRREDWLKDRPGSLNRKEEEKVWVKLWKVYIPAKLRVFLWRLAHQSIPTEDVRMKRHMTSLCTCVVCGMSDSWRHSLMECVMARCVWSLVDQQPLDQLMDNTEPNAKNWLFTMIELLPHDKLVRVTVTLWAIWMTRKKLIHEGINQSLLSTHLFTTHFISELGEI